MSPQQAAVDAYDEFASFYDVFYADRRQEIDFYTSLLRPPDRRLLELGCGTGAIIGAVAAAAARSGTATSAVGLDCSPAMLRLARARYRQVAWLQGDMTMPPVRGPFDVVLCPLNTIQMLPSIVDVHRMFEATRSLLGPEGRFVFDLYNPAGETTSAAPFDGRRRDRVVALIASPAGSRYEVHEYAIDNAAGAWVELDWRVVDTGVTPPVERGRLVVRLHHHAPDVIEHLLMTAGLRIRERYGDVRKSTFDRQRSKKQVIVCSR